MQRLALVLLAACSTPTGSGTEPAGLGEKDFIEKSLATLRTAIAARDESRIMVECAVGESAARYPAYTAEIESLCFTKAPTILLENAIAATKAQNTKNPELADLNCRQLLAGDALKTVAKHPTNDAALAALVTTYTQLCPKEAAKAKAKANASANAAALR